ncbi:interleukin-10 receptor subunit alpha isoform X2 [Paroedura picta]|uniref:interleukin-10 receptor subunit alpha isoform X2 n=1 Tax=Paroedura picta TaxID=143630 RepID=UPI0040566BC6
MPGSGAKEVHSFDEGAPSAAGVRTSPALRGCQPGRYGNYSWTRVARCSSIVRQSCDLSAETLEPSRRYFARVRAVAPDGVSRWTPTGPFSPKEATPQLWNLNLALSGNILRVTLELSLLVGGENSSLAPEGLRPGGWGWYRVHVRRASTDTEYMRVENNQTFELPALLWGERYCVSVEPHLPSQPTPASWTKEECISTPPLTDSARATAIASLALLSLVALGIQAAVWARAYVMKPMKTPLVLKSFRKEKSPWLQKEPWALGLCLAEESVHQISLGLKTHPHPHPARWSQDNRAARQGPGQGMRSMPEVLATCRTGSPQLRHLMDTSGCSTDSGICLQDPVSSHSHSHLLPAGPLECGGLWPGSNGEGGTQKDCGPEPQGAPPARKAELVRLDSAEVLKQAGQPCAQVSGHQRQAQGPGEVLGSSSWLPSLRVMTPSKPILASGYLKQAPVAVLAGPGSLAVAPKAGSTCHGWRHSLSSVAPGGLEPWPCLSEFPKAVLASDVLPGLQLSLPLVLQCPPPLEPSGVQPVRTLS